LAQHPKSAQGTLESNIAQAGNAGADPATVAANQISHRGLVGYFGPDLEDSVVLRRVRQWRRAGFNVRPFAFGRSAKAKSGPDFINLGRVMPLSRASRIMPLGIAVLRLMRRREALKDIDLFVARNLDIAILALLAQWIARSHAPLIYEVLDINASCTRAGWRGALLRSIEKWVLDRIDLLVVSSPYFVTEYYQALLNYRRNWFLFENKVPQDAVIAQPKRPRREEDSQMSRGAPGTERPWRIGWFGYLDDERSWDVLKAVAQKLPDKLEIIVRGTPYTNFDMSRFLADVERLDNVTYGGPYRNPEDLAELYGSVDIVWSTDCNFPTANSKWLLTNSVYEAGYFGKPALGLASTAVGEFLTSRGTGWCLSEPMEETFVEFILNLTAESYDHKCKSIARQSSNVFVETDEIEQVWASLRDLGISAKDLREDVRAVSSPPAEAFAAHKHAAVLTKVAGRASAARAPKHVKMLFMGLFPPPIDGQRVITQRMFECFDAEAEVARAGIDQFPTFGPLSKALSALAGCFVVLRERVRGCATLYLAPHSGLGLTYSSLIVLASRCVGYRIALHYHSYRNIVRRSRLMAVFLAISGPDALHIVLAPPMAKDLRRAYPFVRNIAVLSNAIFSAPRQVVRVFDAKPIHLGHLSNLSLEKGLAIVLECFRELRKQNIDVVLRLGGPPDDDDIARTIVAAQAEFGERLQYLGRLDSSDVHRFYDDIDIFLFPTLYEHEAEPLVIVDALAASVPVIASDRGCIPYLLDDEAGCVFPASDFVDQAVKQVSRWANDPKELAAVSRRSQKRFLAMHDEARANLNHLLAKVLNIPIEMPAYMPTENALGPNQPLQREHLQFSQPQKSRREGP
jgi:succinoglycan biosynthesis protein ExoL